MVEYAALAHGAKQSGGKIFLTRPTSGPMRNCGASGCLQTCVGGLYGEKASYYSAVCLETGTGREQQLRDFG